MHKGIIMLVKAEDKDAALNETRSFLEDYEGQVWDWYAIGGRWNKMLHPLYKKFSAQVLKASKLYERIKQKMSPEDLADDYQLIWETLGGTGKNPYSDDTPYKTEEDDNVCLANECKRVIKKWEVDMNSQAEEHYKRMVHERKKETRLKKANKPSWPYSAYYAKLYANCKYDDFSSESNVYDITNSTNKVPAKLDGYYAVMVDIHH